MSRVKVRGTRYKGTIYNKNNWTVKYELIVKGLDQDLGRDRYLESTRRDMRRGETRRKHLVRSVDVFHKIFSFLFFFFSLFSCLVALFFWAE